MEASDVLKKARARAGITQAELARNAGTSQPVVSAYEHGRREPSIETLRRLVAAAGAVLRIDVAPSASDLAPPRDVHEHAQRLADVLSLADAIPLRPQPRSLAAPRLVSR